MFGTNPKKITPTFRNKSSVSGGFLKWWYPTTMGFPTKNDDFGVFWGYHHLRKHPYLDTPVVLEVNFAPRLQASNKEFKGRCLAKTWSLFGSLAKRSRV